MHTSLAFELTWPVLLFLAGQLIAVLKWGFGLTGKVNSAIERLDAAIEKLEKETYSQKDGNRIESRVNEVERKFYKHLAHHS